LRPPIYGRCDKAQPVQKRKFVSQAQEFDSGGLHKLQAVAERVVDEHPVVAFQGPVTQATTRILRNASVHR
jgi:hypothetical protein